MLRNLCNFVRRYLGRHWALVRRRLEVGPRKWSARVRQTNAAKFWRDGRSSGSWGIGSGGCAIVGMRPRHPDAWAKVAFRAHSGN